MSRGALPEWRLSLRAWQRDAFERWERERPPDALFVATPGAGKTRFATRIAHALLRERAVARTIVVVPREHLKAQVARAMMGALVQLDHGFKNATRTLAADVDGAVVTYQQVAAAPQTFAALARVPTLVILDEIHHAGELATWGQALRDAFGHATYRVALSGTPFRSDGEPIPFVAYAGEECVPLFSYDYEASLRDGVCRALVFPMQGGEAEWISRDGTAMRASFDEGIDNRYASERLRTALTQESWLGDVLAKAHHRLLELRAAGHADAGGLVAAMNQEHARFVASVLERRCGVTPELVVSDLDDASRRIATFSRSKSPWIVAVHMVSEGVDIPRLRVGVFASNVVSELYFRQFCGRFVRTGADANASDREAYVYLPDDLRLRAMAGRITLDVRRGLRAKVERPGDVVALAAAQRLETEAGDGVYESIAATARDSNVLDFGPLFNPAGHFERESAAAHAAHHAPQRPAQHHLHERAAPEPEEPTHAEKRDAIRRDLHGLVSRASVQFSVDHKLVHATLNQRFGGSVKTATLASLEARRRLLLHWLERRVYDGMR